jgi:hypothetical protein
VTGGSIAGESGRDGPVDTQGLGAVWWFVPIAPPRIDNDNPRSDREAPSPPAPHGGPAIRLKPTGL